ncbi:hypothetical protein EDD15DRAFT_2288394 [Pisolithus albus]|nr:hypothetical protein EDD15DRAFT_2288394 [Pisolithus albus]
MFFYQLSASSIFCAACSACSARNNLCLETPSAASCIILCRTKKYAEPSSRQQPQLWIHTVGVGPNRGLRYDRLLS